MNPWASRSNEVANGQDLTIAFLVTTPFKRELDLLSSALKAPNLTPRKVWRDFRPVLVKGKHERRDPESPANKGTIRAATIPRRRPTS
jgi:hypothetical protein